MDPHTFEEMLEVLKPAIKSQRKAREILEKYWSDKMALIWTTQDVHRAANEIETVLTEAEAQEILKDLHRHHNIHYGLKWSDLTTHISDSGLGRDITKRELNRFIHRDILTIQKEKKTKGSRR